MGKRIAGTVKMNFDLLLRILSIFYILITPCLAQFGIAGKKRVAQSFQELNEQAKNAGGSGADAGGLGNLANLMGGSMQEQIENLMKDPEIMKELNMMGDQMGQAFEQLSKMKPEEIQLQMQEAMKMMTGDDVVDTMLENKDEVLESLSTAGILSSDELEKYKANPKYFEEKIKETFGEMREILQDPEMMTKAGEIMKNAGSLFQNNEMFSQIKASLSDLTSDDKIEEARLQLLKDPKLAGDDTLAALFESEEMRKILNDPEKWKENVKQGQGIINGLGGTGNKLKEGAGVGEL